MGLVTGGAIGLKVRKTSVLGDESLLGQAVATGAEAADRFHEVPRIVRTMGGVASFAFGGLHRRVGAVSGEPFPFAAMTGEAEIGPFGPEFRVQVGTVRIMATGAIPLRRRGVHRFPSENRFEIVVAGNT